MAFTEIYPKAVTQQLVALACDQRLSVAKVHAKAVTGQVPGVDPAHVCSLKTLARYVHDEKKRRATEQDELAAQDPAIDPLEAAQSLGEHRCLLEARRLKRKAGQASAKDWQELALLTERLARSRNALRNPTLRGKAAEKAAAQAPEAAPSADALDALPD